MLRDQPGLEPYYGLAIPPLGSDGLQVATAESAWPAPEIRLHEEKEGRPSPSNSGIPPRQSTCMWPQAGEVDRYRCRSCDCHPCRHPGSCPGHPETHIRVPGASTHRFPGSPGTVAPDGAARYFQSRSHRLADRRGVRHSAGVPEQRRVHPSREFLLVDGEVGAAVPAAQSACRDADYHLQP